MASQDQLFFTPDLHCKFGDLVGEEAIKELRDDHTQNSSLVLLTRFNGYPICSSLDSRI